jgi:hypothetical protein
MVIHCEPRIPWQPKRAAYFVEGFKAKGIPCEVTDSRVRIADCPAVLLGTSCWRGIERDGGEFLLVDRCSFGDTERFVSLVWNGHGRRGDHRVPENVNGERWERYGLPLLPWRLGSRVILCGQTETYSPHWRSLNEWYASVGASHFRPHPAGTNSTGLPEAADFSDCQIAVTLNSSIGVKTVIEGIPTITMDKGAMAWAVTGHSRGEIRMPDRREWANWLAWTQWTDDELREGIPWDWHL